MYRVLRRFLFQLPPDVAHQLGLGALKIFDGAGEPGVKHDVRLRVQTRAMGDLVFPSPIGIAGGFDKNAEVPFALERLGFGFLELGTVTGQAQEANPSPNLFRLPADRALVNRLGFPNRGAERVAAHFAKRCADKQRPKIPVGFSIGKSRAVSLDPLEDALDDYARSFAAVHPVSDFVVVNVSSPNTKGLRALQTADVAKRLFDRLQIENRARGPKPLLVKVAPDLDDGAYDALLAAVVEGGLAGVIATNTTLRRDGLKTPAGEIARIGDGGLSGPPLAPRARAMVHRAREVLGAEATVIGVGGIETADDVLAMLRAGADLVQMYTSFVYGGPLAAYAMAREILRKIEAAGVTSLADLVAANAVTPYR